MKKLLVTILCCSVLLSAAAQSSKSKKINLDGIAEQFAIASFDEFYQLHSLPNDAHFPADIEKNVQWCEAAFSKRGFTTQRLNTETVPLLLAEYKVAHAQKTVLIYLQIDGQPVEPSQWNQESPWKPTLKEKGSSGEWNILPYEKLKTEKINRDWRIFVRSASDAKGPAMAFLASLDALKSLKKQPNFNMKVIMDFEEELGSPRLPGAVTKYQQALKADMFIIFDGPRHVSNEPTLSFGARGICEDYRASATLVHRPSRNPWARDVADWSWNADLTADIDWQRGSRLRAQPSGSLIFRGIIPRSSGGITAANDRAVAGATAPARAVAP